MHAAFRFQTNRGHPFDDVPEANGISTGKGAQMSGWRDSAACRDHDPELWFSGKPYEQAAALAVCRQCPVIDECRAFADDNNRISGYPLQGIWGGKQYGRTSRPRKERE